MKEQIQILMEQNKRLMLQLLRLSEDIELAHERITALEKRNESRPVNKTQMKIVLPRK